MRVKTIGVVGAGIMGRGIAQVAAHGGFHTVLQDVDAKQLEVARKSIECRPREAGRAAEDFA